jgi:hypothetical protein
LASEAFVSSPEQDMPNRTAKFLSTIVAGCLAGAALTGVSHGETPAPDADECLSGPKGQAPSGNHWYYRIERGTKRHCWYLGPQRDARAQATPANQSAPANQAAPGNAASIVPAKAVPSATPAPPKADAAMSGTVVNARAELTAPQARGAQEANAAGQVSSATPAGTPSADNGAGAMGANPDAQQSPIAARWPDQLAANEPDAAEPATDNSAAGAQTQLAAPPPPNTPVAAAPVAAAVAAGAPLADTEDSSAKESGSIQTLLIVIAGALALAGLAGSAIVRFSGRWRRDDQESEDDRSAMWDAVRADHQSRPIFQEPVGVKLASLFPGELRAAGAPRSVSAPRAAGALRKANAPRATKLPRAAGDSDDNIAEMLARLARSAQS